MGHVYEPGTLQTYGNLVEHNMAEQNQGHNMVRNHTCTMNMIWEDLPLWRLNYILGTTLLLPETGLPK